jgi:uncharacterized membrane protein YecN with MAPEG domain
MNSSALICTACLGILLFGLGFTVSVLRARERTTSGFAADPANILTKAVRAHGNTAEYAPFLAVRFLYRGAHGPSAYLLGLMVAATACRFLVAFALIAWPTMAKPNPARFVGALGTYVFGALLSMALLSGSAMP